MKEKTNRCIYNRSWRKNNPERYQQLRRIGKARYVAKYPGRQLFAYKILDLLKKGKIKKKPCVNCGSTKLVQACSLSNVYDPLWLCDTCNKALHKRIRGYT